MSRSAFIDIPKVHFHWSLQGARKFILPCFFIILAASVESVSFAEENAPRRPNPLKLQTDMANEIDFLSQKLEYLKTQKEPPDTIKTVAQKIIDASEGLSMMTDGARGIDLRKQVELYHLTGNHEKFAAASALLEDNIKLDILTAKVKKGKVPGDTLGELSEEMAKIGKMSPSKEKQAALRQFKDKFAEVLVEMSDPMYGIPLTRDPKNPASAINVAEIQKVKTLVNFLNKAEQETAGAMLQKSTTAANHGAEIFVQEESKRLTNRLIKRGGFLAGLGIGAVTLVAEYYVDRQLSNVKDMIVGDEAEQEPFSKLRFVLWGPSAVEGSADFIKYHSTKPDVIEMKVTVKPSRKGIRAMAIPLNGMPENFNCDIDANGKGFGNSTWDHGFKPVLGHIVFRGTEPLEEGKTTTAVVHFPIYWEYVERYGFFELADPINRVMDKLLKIPINKKTVRLARISEIPQRPPDPEWWNEPEEQK